MTATPYIPSTSGKFQKVIAEIQDSSNREGIRFQDETGTAYGIKHVNNKPRVSSMPYLFDIAEGIVSNELDNAPLYPFLVQDSWSETLPSAMSNKYGIEDTRGLLLTCLMP